MNTRKKLMVCTAACLLTAGTVIAQDNTFDADRANATPRIHNSERLAANDGTRQNRADRFMHRVFPRDANVPFYTFSQSRGAVETPTEVLTAESMIQRNSLD